jgi:hypothetical protein
MSSRCTIAAANTRSVGESTAPTNSARIHDRSVNSTVRPAMPSIVSGMPTAAHDRQEGRPVELTQRQPLTVGEQDGDQSDLGERRDDRILGTDIDNTEHAWSQHHAEHRTISDVDSGVRDATPEISAASPSPSPYIATRFTSSITRYLQCRHLRRILSVCSPHPVT